MGGDDRVKLLEKQLEETKVEKQQFNRTEEALMSVVKSQIESLPKDLRGAVESMPGDAVAKAVWLQENMSTLSRRRAPNLKGGTDSLGDGGVQLSEADRAAMARAKRVGNPYKDEADYLASKKQAQKRYGG